MPVWFWIIIAVLVLLVLFGGKGKSWKMDSSAKPFRIDHPHYMSEDKYECSRCHARFREAAMECPGCGARFGTATTDDTEFIEEMELYDGDEEDGQ